MKTLQSKSNDPCNKCGGNKFKNKITTFPLPIPDGKIINVQKIAVKECLQCHQLIPTQAGKEKLARCVTAYYMLPG